MRIKPLKIIVTVLCLATYTLLALYSSKRFVADIFYFSGRKELKANNAVVAEYYLNRAIYYNETEPRYYRELAKNQILQSSRVDSDEQKRILLEKASVLLTYSITLNEDNLVSLRDALPVFYLISKESGSAEDRETSNEWLQIASNRHEKDLGVQILVAKYSHKNSTSNEDTEFTKIILEKIRNLRPDVLEWHPELLAIQQDLGLL